MMADLDVKLMNRALELARLGDPSPNPHVGCVVAQGAEIVGEGHHESAGREHAEVVAINSAGNRTKGATLYVTLEPCNHHGRTPPCVEKILQAEIARVVIGCRDPNPTVPGNGLERLKASGVEITAGCLEAECRQLILPWTKYVTQQRSFLALKLAVSLDGRIATRTGASKWITCPESRARVHELRGAHDAVMVGINTVHSDDPRLTVRDVPGRNPIRIVVDSKLRMPMTSHLVATAREIPTCIITTQEASRAVGDAIEAAGISLIRVPGTAEGRCDMQIALTELAAREVVSVLCEGGAELAGSLLAAGLVDAMHVFVAPILLGPRGRPGAVDWAGPESPADAPRIEKPRWELCGADAYVSGTLIYPKRTART